MQPRRPDAPQHSSVTYTTMTGSLLAVRIELLDFGRRLELDPERWGDARTAFEIATHVGDAMRLEALR